MTDKAEYVRRLQADVLAAEQRQERDLAELKNAPDPAALDQALGKVAALTDPGAVAKAMDAFQDKTRPPALRLQVLRKSISALADNAEYVQHCLAALADRSEPIALRKGILRILKILSFSSKAFFSARSDYMALLRTLLDDPDQSLRELAAEELSKYKDEYVQRRLLDGLTHREPPILSPAKAVQLLGYDIHAAHYPILRNLLLDPASTETTKVEAIHVLAGDPESKDLLLRLLRDKKQEKEVRLTSAVALQGANPETFAEVAKPMVLDETEEPDVRAVCLNALMHRKDANTLYADPVFAQKIRQMNAATASPGLQKLGNRYLENARKQMREQ